MAQQGGEPRTRPGAPDDLGGIPVESDGDPFDEASTARVMLDSAGVVTEWSEGARRLLGYTATETVGRPARELLAEPARPASPPPAPSAGTAPWPCGTATATPSR